MYFKKKPAPGTQITCSGSICVLCFHDISFDFAKFNFLLELTSASFSNTPKLNQTDVIDY